MNDIQLDDLAISHDNNLYLPKDVVGEGNYLYSSLVLSDTIPCNDAEILHSNLTVKTMDLLNDLILVE